MDIVEPMGRLDWALELRLNIIDFIKGDKRYAELVENLVLCAILSAPPKAEFFQVLLDELRAFSFQLVHQLRTNDNQLLHYI